MPRNRPRDAAERLSRRLSSFPSNGSDPGGLSFLACAGGARGGVGCGAGTRLGSASCEEAPGLWQGAGMPRSARLNEPSDAFRSPGLVANVRFRGEMRVADINL